MNETVMNIWTDGACRGNPGPGAWGFHADMQGIHYDCYEYYRNTTNNMMELEAVKQVLIFYIKSARRARLIYIYTDSEYVCFVFNTWIWGWLRKGTITQKKNFETILDIQLLLTLLRSDKHMILIEKVKGHSGDIGNNRADANCNFALDTQSRSLPMSNDYSYVNHLRSICDDQEIERFDKMFQG